ncbi:MAG: hypothetical protein IGS39_10450 [Calothrix sp. C42_A2020_038]|nr:hypothetical protein [Calothrix sp. C42_A2020_038]
MAKIQIHTQIQQSLWERHAKSSTFLSTEVLTIVVPCQVMTSQNPPLYTLLERETL